MVKNMPPNSRIVRQRSAERSPDQNRRSLGFRRPGGALFGLAAPLLIGIIAWQAGVADTPAAKSAPTSRPAAADNAQIDSLGGGIISSKHDFSARGEDARGLCLPCHTPHITAGHAPLLVRQPAATQPVRSYGTTTMELNDASLVCMSCHDGTVAPDVFAGAHAATWSDASNGSVTAGRPRLTSHPVGIAYPTDQQKYRAESEVTQSGKIKLPDGRIQCVTCHDPHNTDRNAKLLRVSNERSRLCLSCHRI
ncbi:MAG: hypothetical protein HZB38_10385 [Planctomycetes bacterium]|nr:hypothetical protein [Planctomycetota bacterium]